MEVMMDSERPTTRMKTFPYIVGSAVSLFVLLAPVHAEETTPAPTPAPKSSTENNLSLGATLLADLLKQASGTTSEKGAPAAAPADAQTQELQALLISVMKSIAQMLPQFLAALDQSGGGGDSFDAKVDDFLGAASGPIKKAREVGLHSAGLKTSGLNQDGSPSATSDDDWKRQFQRREPGR